MTPTLSALSVSPSGAAFGSADHLVDAAMDAELDCLGDLDCGHAVADADVTDRHGDCRAAGAGSGGNVCFLIRTAVSRLDDAPGLGRSVERVCRFEERDVDGLIRVARA